MRIVFLNPGNDQDPFYGNMARFARRAAASLDIDLEVLECDRDPSLLRERGRDLAGRSSSPDYLVLVNDGDAAVELLPIFCRTSIKVLLVNQGLWVADRSGLGEPRKDLKGWLGELLPNDEQAGYLLAQTLIQRARELQLRGADGRIRIHGLAGTYTIASILRLNGLRKAIAEHHDVDLGEVAPMNWDQEKARGFCGQLLDRERETHLIWSASDGMALGACEAVEAAGRKPGKDVVLGGIDWAPFALDRVRNGSFTATVGGHFMDLAWALVMLYDYHNGRDFGAETLRTDYLALTQGTIDDLVRILDETLWSDIDFTSYSRARNPSIESYAFRV